MVQPRIPDAYSYFFDIIKAMKNGEKLPIDEINLVGGRKSAKSTTVQLSCGIVRLLGLDNVGIVCLRDQKVKAAELQEDFENVFDAYQIPYRSVKKKGRIFVGGGEIRFLGANNGRKNNLSNNSGLAKFPNVKYLIIFFEERFEFREDDIKAAMEAVRNVGVETNNELQYLVINACNPWAKSSPYISYCGKHQTWDINKLKTVGSQVGIYNIPLKDGRVKRALFHYTNWRVAKEFLSEGDIKNILDLWNIDERRAATSDWGLPGYEQGAIYTHLLNNLGKAIYQEHEYLVGGLDYGWGRDSNSGKTVAYFLGYTSDNGIDIYNEYVQDNHEFVKSPDKVANEVCMFYFEAMRDYCNRIGWGSAFNIKVRVDNMAVGFIQLLNNEAKRLGFNWLQFIKCKKYNVNDRIEITLSVMYRHQLRLNDRVKLLKDEMELSYYEETNSQNQKRAKVNDHAINAFEYAIEPFMFKLAKNNSLTNIAYKLKDRRE